MMDIEGNMPKKEMEAVRKIMLETHNKLKKYQHLKRLVYKTKSGKNFFYKIRLFSDADAVVGLNSNSFASDGKHILMADFDLNKKRGITIPSIGENVIKVQKKLDLPSCLFYKSSRMGVFVLCFTELGWDEVLLAYSMLKNQDPNHIYFALRNHFATLRTGPKSDKPSDIKFHSEIVRESKTRKELVGARELFDEMIKRGSDG